MAEKCKLENILFIGPSASCISAVGDKVSARQVAKKAGVPVIPGTEDSVFTPDQVYAFANKFGYPIMLKARDGGGGRGIRMVHEATDVPDSLTRCLNESPSNQVFIEKAITNAKHIEVQILGDSHGNIIHLFERDCSAQRRYQKILEVFFRFIYNKSGYPNNDVRLHLALVCLLIFVHPSMKQQLI
ncbi:MAG: ATP-grasp domain-containing protein [Paenibacillus sp.]|nr:ATP-grasp domain-containing protein [Paenibacillus sp.]